MSTQFLTDPKVERMVDQHGNDAIAVAIALFTQAMLQERGGTIERTYKTLAAEANTDRQTAFAIIQTAAEVGFVNLDHGDDFEFVATLPAWSRHQATFRKARSRAAKKAHEQADVTDGHDESRPVTKSHSQDKTRHNKRRQESKPPPSVEDAPLSHLLADLVAANDPNGKRPTVSSEWAVEEDRMLRLDGRDPAQAEKLIRWTQADSFWCGNVMSMPKFRKQYGQLYQAAVDESKKRKRGPRAGMDRAREIARMAEEAEREEARAAA